MHSFSTTRRGPIVGPVSIGSTRPQTIFRGRNFLWVSLLLLLGLSQTAQAQTTSPQTFAFTGVPQTFVVPPGVTSLSVVANGAQGGNVVGNFDSNGQPSPGGGYNSNGNPVTAADGGKGGRVTATLFVMPGQTLSINVGSSAGYNGGGSAGGNQGDSGPGGGATDIQIANSRLLIAGGGGGGGNGETGGDGGGIQGADSPSVAIDVANGNSYPGGGRGGSQTGGGIGGNTGFGAVGSGSAGNGGNGGQSGGGGGGGYYGGGGGDQSSGGGGSSYPDNTQPLPAGIANVVHTQGANTGAGSLTISWAAAATPPTRLYVNASTTGTADGLTWATAFTDLQAALTYPNSTSLTEIWVAGGVYKPTTKTNPNAVERRISFVMLPGVAIYGGFPSTGNPTFAQRNLTYPSSTTLSGDVGTAGDNSDNIYHVINNPTGLTNTAILDGFVITGGNANDMSDFNGGGMLNNGSSPAITNCLFINNQASQRGGAIYNYGGSLTSNPTLTNCAFVNNIAGQGAAIYNGGIDGSGSPVLINCSFLRNTGSYAIYNYANSGGNSSPVLTNCSFQGNTDGAMNSTADGDQTGNGSANPTLTNCIFWNNGDANTFFNTSATITSTYSLFDATVTNYAGSNNLTTTFSPFISANSVALNSCSPAINAGSNEAYNTAGGPAKDLAGQPRLYSSEQIDMGAVEFQAAPTVGPARLYVNASQTTNLADGLTWNTAFPDLQSALSYGCRTSLTEIWVAKGTYKPTTGTDRTVSFSMLPGVAIYGGFDGGETNLTQRPLSDPATKLPASMLSGDIGTAGDATDNTHSVIKTRGLSANAVLDGFVITGGQRDGQDGDGAGMQNLGSSPTVRNCAFIANNGGNGGAIYNFASMPQFINCAFINNSGGNGGALYNIDGVITVNGSVRNAFSDPVLTNCSFQGNTASNLGALVYNRVSNATLTNCLLWNNGGSNAVASEVFGATTVKYSVLDASTNPATYTDGGNNLTTRVSPFISASSVALNACSPAINAGDNTAYTAVGGPATDLAGLTRTVGASIDMGAVEFAGTTVSGPARLYVNASQTTNTADGLSWNTAFPDLQQALTYFCPNNLTEIWVAGGVYKPTTGSDRAISFAMPPNVAVYGGFAGGETAIPARMPGTPSSTTLSGDIGAANDLTDNSYHVVLYGSGAGTPVLDGVVITGGNARPATNTGNFRDNYGGGVFVYTTSGSSSPRLSHVTFTQNSGRYGAGLSVYADGNVTTVASPTITHCVFTSNTAISDDGGGIFLEDDLNATVSGLITSSTFVSNSAMSDDGGALYFDVHGSVAIQNCLFEANYADDEGGAIYADAGSYTITNSRFLRNIGDYAGGAIHHYGDEYGLIDACLFDGNSSSRNGGAFFYDGDSDFGADLKNSVFQNNTANGDGGAIRVNDSRLTTTNCLFKNNSATDQGGGIYTTYALLLINNVITGNTASQGGGIYNTSSLTAINNTVAGNSTTGTQGGGGIHGEGLYDNASLYLANSIVWGNTAGGGSVAEQQVFTGTTDNGGNGNPPATLALNSLVQGGLSAGTTDQGGNLTAVTASPFVSATDLQLNDCSPAINAGNNAAYAAVNGPATDLAGATRLFGSTIDMGAYEFQGTASQPVSITAQPVASSVVCAGATVTATVSVSGGVSGYQWYKGATMVASQTAATLSLANVQVSDAGSYSVVVTGGCNSVTSTAFSLSVNALPTLTISPEATTITQGLSATLTASGSVNSFSWSTGQTTASISVSATGSYVVSGTNSAGCSATASAMVSTTLPPALNLTLTTSATGVVCVGSPVGLSVVATGGLMPYTYAWTAPAGVNLSASSTSAVSASATSSGVKTLTLTVSSANGGPVSSETISITAADAVRIVAQPASQSVVCAGVEVNVPVSATGTGTYQWYRNGASVSGQTAATLSLAAATTAQAGSYSVVVSGGCNSVTSTAFSLTVNAIPVVTIAASATLIQGGQSTTLTASGASSYSWSTGSSQTVISVSPVGDTRYTVQGTTLGCSATATVLVSVGCNQATAKATSSVVMSQLGPNNCAVMIMPTGTGNAFVYTDATGKVVYSTVYRTGGTYTLPSFTVSKPGTYIMDAYYTNNCGQVTQDQRRFEVGGTACN
jgi:predicted outer membrane repeat protein